MYTSKGVKGCFILDMSSATGASTELEDMWSLPPDYMFQKSWLIFLKSSTCSLHLLWGNSRWVGWDSQKYTLNEPTASEFRQHSSSPSALLLHTPALTCCCFFPLLLPLPQLLFLFHPSYYIFVRDFSNWSQQFSRPLNLFRSLWSTTWSSTLPGTRCLFQDIQDPARLPGSNSPGMNLLGKQDFKAIKHCL